MNKLRPPSKNYTPTYHVLPNTFSTTTTPASDESKFSPSAFEMEEPVHELPSTGKSRSIKNRLLQSPEGFKLWGFRGFMWRVFFTPMMLAALIAFGWAIYKRPIIISDKFNSNTFPAIKGLWTSFLIVFLFLALVPLNDAVSDVKSEEFFRLVAVPGASGKPLEVVNEISTLSHGVVDQAKKIMRGYSTRYIVVAIVVGIFGLVISAAGPGMLTIGTAFYDSDLYALQIGSIPPSSIFNNSDLIFTDPTLGNDHQNYSRGGLLAWAATSFGMEFSFKAPENVLIPLPVTLSMDESAYFLTDVAILNPTCQYYAPSNVRANLGDNSIMASSLATISPDMNVAFNIPAQNLTIDVLYWNSILNTTTNDVSSEGISAFLLAKNPQTIIDFSGLPTTNIAEPGGNNTYDTTILLCRPNIDFQTRKVFADGIGNLLFADDKQYYTRGNLQHQQTQMMLSFALQSLTSGGSGSGGPLSPLGTQFETTAGEGTANIVFGPYVQSQADVGDLSTLKPMSLADIEKAYSTSVIAASKGFVDGRKIGSTFVPARKVQAGTAIISALPQLVLASVLWIFLVILLSYTYFRPPSRPFVFTTIAASLAGSNIPDEIARHQASVPIWTLSSDKKVMQNVGKRQLWFDNFGGAVGGGVQPSKGIIRMDNL